MPVLFDGLVKDFCLESIEAAEESIERKQIRNDFLEKEKENKQHNP